MKKGNKTMELCLLATVVILAAVICCILWGRNRENVQETETEAYTETFSFVSDPENSQQTQIELADEDIRISGNGASAAGSTVYITQAGTYQLSGTLTNGQVYVEAGKEDSVVLILNGVDLKNDAEAAIHIENAGQTQILLQGGTTNRIQSGSESQIGSVDGIEEDASGGAIYARDDLAITGDGELQIFGYLNNGIQTSNHLWVDSGSYEVTAINHGIKGKDAVTISGGIFSIHAGGDGIKSDDTTGEGYGVISISDGDFDIQVSGDGIQAETGLDVTGGTFTIVTGNQDDVTEYPSVDGQNNSDLNWDREDTGAASMKGLKSGDSINVSGGTFTLDTADDAIHTNGEITIGGGSFEIRAGDDGIHGDLALLIEGGEIRVFQSYEGLEANQIQITEGSVDVTASDDGVNAYGGQNNWGRGGESRSDAPEETANLTITGGDIQIHAEGDGLDSNGNISVEGGTVIVDGPSGNWNGAIDSGSENGGSCVVNGGTVLAIGSSGMAETFSEESEQYSFRHNYDATIPEGSTLVITDAFGTVLMEHQTEKPVRSVVFSSPELERGEMYQVTAGEQSVEITLDSVSTSSGGRMRWSW